MFESGITNLDTAKAYYLAMDCSPYQMAKDHPKLYSQYRRLRIPKLVEKVWEEEKFEYYYGRLVNCKKDDTCCLAFIRICELAASMGKKAYIQRVVEFANSVLPTLEVDEQLVLVESMLGVHKRNLLKSFVEVAHEEGGTQLSEVVIGLVLYILDALEPQANHQFKLASLKTQAYAVMGRLAI